MIAFHLTFGFVLIVVALTSYGSNLYLKLMRMTASLAEIKEVNDAMRANPKHRSSLDRLKQEYAIYTTVWQPIIFAAYAYLASAYLYGAQNNWMLTEGYVLFGTLIFTPIFARLYIHKPDFPWLLGWHASLQSVLTVCQQEAIIKRIDALRAIEERTDQQDEELAELQEALLVFRQIIGTPTEQQKSERTE